MASKILSRVPPPTRRGTIETAEPQSHGRTSGTVPVMIKCGSFLRYLFKPRLRTAADEGNPASRHGRLYFRANVVEEKPRAVNIRKPVHRSDKDQVGFRLPNHWRSKVAEVHACRDAADVIDAIAYLHGIPVPLGDGDHIAGIPANCPFVSLHTSGLPFQIGSSNRITGLRGMALPNSGLDVVLKQYRVAHTWNVRSGKQKVTYDAVEGVGS